MRRSVLSPSAPNLSSSIAVSSIDARTVASASIAALALATLCALWLSVPARADEVTLPLAQYEELRARAQPDDDDAPAPPAPFALESADVLITAGAESATVTQTLELAIYADGPLVVPVGEAGSFTAARLGQLAGRVEVSADAKAPGWTLAVHGRGRHRVALDSVVPLKRDDTATRPTRQLALRLPPAAVVRGRLDVGGSGAMPVEEVELEGAGLLHRDGPGAWSFVAKGDATATFTLRGARTLPERAQLPLRFETTAATAATLSRTRLRVHGWVEARVAQGRLETLRVALPPGLEVVNVDGPVAGWRVEEGVLVITPLAPIETALAVQVTLEGKPATELPSPLLRPQQAHRTLLLARAALEGDGLLDLVDAGAARIASEAETKSLPPSLSRAGGVVYAVLDPARPPRFEVTWAEREEVLAAQVDRLLVDVAIGDSQRAAYQLWAEVRNRGAQQLVLTLPPGFELVAGSRDGEPIAAGAGDRGLVVPLAGGAETQVVYVAGLLPLALPSAAGELAVPLPALSAPAARVETRVLLPSGRSYTLDDPTRARAVQPPPADAATAARREAALASNVIAQQIGWPMADGARTVGFFIGPPGFVELEAVWSALSPAPAPLLVHVRSRKEAASWF